MKFQIEISKIFNKFHFISNLTEWHFSCRRNCNKRWLELTGPLNKQEKESLKKFTKILNKYNFGERFIGKSFVAKNEKDAWKNLKIQLTKKEFSELEDIFSVFDGRFEKLWKKEKKNLYNGKQIFKRRLSNKKIIKIIRAVSVFLKCEKLPRLIMIYPLWGHPNSIGGGANIGKEKITIEYCNLKESNQLNNIVTIILHETFHVMAKKSRYYEKNIDRVSALINKRSNKTVKGKGINGYIIANEAVINSLLPYGYLKKYLFGVSDEELLKVIDERIKKAKSDYYKWTCFATKNLYYLTKKYFENKKPIDKYFFDQVIDTFKNFKNLNKNKT